MVKAFKALGKRIAELTYDYVLAPLGNMILAGIKSLMLEVFVYAPARFGLATLQSTLRIFGNYLFNFLDSLYGLIEGPIRVFFGTIDALFVSGDWSGAFEAMFDTLYDIFNVGTLGLFGWLSALWKEWIGNWAGDMALGFGEKLLQGFANILPETVARATGIMGALTDVSRKKAAMLAEKTAQQAAPSSPVQTPATPTAPQTAIPAAPSTGIFGQTPVAFGKQQQQQNVNLVASIDKLNENTDRLATILDKGIDQNLTAMGEVMAREKMFVAAPSYG